MASFGVRPYENDNAKLWYLAMTLPISNEIEKMLSQPVDSQHYDSYRAAAWLLIKIGREHVYDANRLTDHLSKLHDRLQSIKNDLGYIATWKSPTEFVHDLDDLIQQLQRVCKWNNVVITF